MASQVQLPSFFGKMRNEYLLTFLIILVHLMQFGVSVCQYGLNNVAVTQFLAKKGFHRDLVLDVEWIGKAECHVLLQQTIPNGMYVDLQQLNAYHKQFKVISSSKSDVEAPAHKASAQDIWIYPSQQQYQSIRKDQYSVSVILPVHLRYHTPLAKPRTSHMVTMETPRILAKCEGQQSGDCKIVQTACITSQEKCNWVEIDQVKPNVLTVTVPVGNVNHTVAVTIVTTLFTVLGALWVLKVTFQN